MVYCSDTVQSLDRNTIMLAIEFSPWSNWCSTTEKRICHAVTMWDIKKVLFMICDQTKLNKKELGVNLTAPAWTVLWSESAQKNIVSSPWRSPPSKAEAKLEDGISTLGLTTYGRRYMEATMALYFNFSGWQDALLCYHISAYEVPMQPVNKRLS